MSEEMEKNVSEETDVSPRRNYAEELLSLFAKNIPAKQLKEELSNYHESDIAEILPELTKEERLRLYKLLGDEQVSEIFAYVDDVEQFIEELSNEKAADIIEEMDADEAIDVLEELGDERRQEIIGLLDEDVAKDIKLISEYDDDLIGSRMTTNFVTVDLDMSIKDAMRSVVEQAAENDNISTIYVTDKEGVYKGAFSLRDLVIARNTSSVEKITITAYPFFYDDEQISQCIEELKEYSEDSIPILNRENKILGVITSNELVDVVDEELGEDYAKLAGLTDEEDLDEPIVKSVSKRLPWLALLMALGLVVSSLIGTFEYVIAALPLLVTFQSLILDMSGNGGTQSLAVTIRVITANTLSTKEKFRLVFKEIRVGLLNGFIIGSLATILCTLYIFFLKDRPIEDSIAIAACIGVSLLTAMTFSSFGGTIIPLVFKKIKIDPAVASGPMITTINDLIAATLYYTLANVLLVTTLGIH